MNSFPPGKSSNAAGELRFSRPGSATADHPVQDTALSYPPFDSQSLTDGVKLTSSKTIVTGNRALRQHLSYAAS